MRASISEEQILETSLHFTWSFEKNSANDYGFAITIIRLFLICVRKVREKLFRHIQNSNYEQKSESQRDAEVFVFRFF